MARVDYVVGFVFCRNAVLLIKKARPAWQRGRYNGIGGHIEPGENPAEAMARECAEETLGLVHIPASAWTHFATITGSDVATAHRVGAEQTTFRLYCFVTELPEWISGIEQATYALDEPVRWVRAVLATAALPCLPNLSWLIPMALAAPKIQHDLPYLIQERAVP